MKSWTQIRNENYGPPTPDDAKLKARVFADPEGSRGTCEAVLRMLTTIRLMLDPHSRRDQPNKLAQLARLRRTSADLLQARLDALATRYLRLASTIYAEATSVPVHVPPTSPLPAPPILTWGEPIGIGLNADAIVAVYNHGPEIAELLEDVKKALAVPAAAETPTARS